MDRDSPIHLRVQVSLSQEIQPQRRSKPIMSMVVRHSVVPESIHHSLEVTQISTYNLRLISPATLELRTKVLI